MASPSIDFIRSLEDLFAEAGEKGRDAKTEFVHLRSSIIDFIVSSEGLTAAKARAKYSLKFTDGANPKKHIAFFPLKFNLSEKGTQLDAANTAEEFIEILRTLINEQKQRVRKEKNANKKKASSSPPPSPMNNAQKRLEAEAVPKNSSTADDSPRKRIKLNTHKNRSDISGSPISSTTYQPKDSTVTEAGKGKVTNGSDSDALGPMDIDSGTVSSQNREDAMDAQQKSIEENNQQHPVSQRPSPNQQDTHMNEVAETLPSYCGTDILEVIAAAKVIEARQWGDFKPKLLEMLDQMHEEPTPEQHEKALKRLHVAITTTEPERSLIPIDAWKAYEEKLVGESKKGLFDCEWSRRLSNIGKIIYLPEEETAMETRDWKRLCAAARMCAILTEMTAKPEEQANQEFTDQWLIEKLGDISFLEKLFACKERLGAIQGLGKGIDTIERLAAVKRA
ncbi:hypothetical protein FBEOM_11996 [Fusarium beomiforme]|uniref:Uncharacterized protein n=1 Tax=Fusarium beomiforme TaxID=44412 RepID=A0A9P5A8M9_9HYPO|nr:hypothetical protein FBEOM_11996 [Fusarium beomiforme]